MEFLTFYNYPHIGCSCSFLNQQRKCENLSCIAQLCTNKHRTVNMCENIFYSILFYPITLEGRRGTTDEFATTPFHLDLFSAALVELAKSIPVHSLILSSHLFFCLPLFLFPTSCNSNIRICLAKVKVRNHVYQSKKCKLTKPLTCSQSTKMSVYFYIINLSIIINTVHISNYDTA